MATIFDDGFVLGDMTTWNQEPGYSSPPRHGLRDKDPTVSNWETTWIRTTMDQKLVPTPPVDFYVNMPEEAPSLISVLGGSVKRSLGHPLPFRESSVWSIDRIHEAAVHIRQKCPWVRVEQPFRFEQLYRYFDAYDLHNCGAWNLWRVIVHMVDQENLADGSISASMAWANFWISHDGNKIRLSSWTPDKGDILGVLSECDWVYGGSMAWDERRRDQLRRILHRYHECSWPGPEGFVDDDGTFYKGHGRAPFESVMAWMDTIFMGIEAEEANLRPESWDGNYLQNLRYFRPVGGRVGAASVPTWPVERQSLGAHHAAFSSAPTSPRTLPATKHTSVAFATQAPAVHDEPANDSVPSQEAPRARVENRPQHAHGRGDDPLHGQQLQSVNAVPTRKKEKKKMKKRKKAAVASW